MVRDPSIVSPSLTGVFIGGGHNKHGTGSRCTLPEQCRPPSPRRRWRLERSGAAGARGGRAWVEGPSRAGSIFVKMRTSSHSRKKEEGDTKKAVARHDSRDRRGAGAEAVARTTGAVTPLPLRRPPTPHPDIPTPPHKERKHTPRRDGRTARRRHTHRDFTSSHSRARLGSPDFSRASPVPSVVRGSLV